MNSGQAATLQDIADRVGVSRSTVSFAITGRGRLSAATRERVLAVADELGYQPNTLARRLRSSRTGIIALRLPRDTTSMSYYMEATFGVVEEAQQAGMLTTMLPADAMPVNGRRIHADGVILLDPMADDPSAQAILSGPLPVVSGEPVPPGLPPAAGEVTSKHARAVDELMSHLAARGAKYPALIIPDVQMHWVMTVRTAFEDWCVERGIGIRIAVVSHPAGPTGIHQQVANLLSDADSQIDAVVAGSDGIVLNLVTSAEQLGRRVGTDLLVAAVVDSDVLALTRPTITAIDLHPREFGRRCVRVLLRLIDPPPDAGPATYQEIVPLALRPRASTLGRY